MQPLKMKKASHMLLFALPLLLMITVAGCSSGDSVGSSTVYTQKVYIIGEIEPPASDATGGVTEQTKNVFVNRVAYDGVSTDAPIFIAANSIASLSDTVKAGILSTYQNNYPVILINGTETEINTLLGIVGLEENFSMSSDVTYAEMFAVDHEDNHSFTWILYPPVEGTETHPDGTTTTVTDSAEARSKRVELLRGWMTKDGDRLTAAAKSARLAATSALASAASSDGSSELTSIADGFNTTISHTKGKNIYQFSYWIYSCHSFNETDGNEYDWFYIRQEAELSASGEYNFYEWYKGNFCAAIDYYIHSYAMDNWMVDYTSTSSGVNLMQSSPENKVNSETTTSSIEYDLSGNIGFDLKGLSGKVDGGLKIKNETEFKTHDCTVTNKSLDNYHNAKWLYEFPDVKQIVYIYYSDLEKPTELAKGYFQPRNQWLWKFSSDLRDKSNAKKFRSKFNVTKTWSKGGNPYFYWCAYPMENRHEDAGEWTDDIKLTYPPILVVTHNLDFTAEGSYKSATVTVSRDWTASSSDESWCTIKGTSGTKDDTVVYVTVAANTTGASRTATITFKTADGKATDKLSVYQSEY